MARNPPIRTCIACGATGDKRGLVRVVRSPEGTVYCDASGKAAGRGAYVCRSEACFEKADRKHLFDARLRVKLAAQDRKRLEEEFRALLAGAQAAQ